MAKTMKRGHGKHGKATKLILSESASKYRTAKRMSTSPMVKAAVRLAKQKFVEHKKAIVKRKNEIVAKILAARQDEADNAFAARVAGLRIGNGKMRKHRN